MINPVSKTEKKDKKVNKFSFTSCMVSHQTHIELTLVIWLKR